MTDRPAEEAVADLAHELKLLLDLIVEHSTPWLDRVRAASPGPHDAAAELAARAFIQAAQMVALIRAVLADRWHPDEGVHMPGFEPVGPRGAPNVALGALNAPNSAFAPPPVRPSTNGGPKRSGSPRVQRVSVRKIADPGERQP